MIYKQDDILMIIHPESICFAIQQTLILVNLSKFMGIFCIKVIDTLEHITNVLMQFFMVYMQLPVLCQCLANISCIELGFKENDLL